jgi:hypothetical protein
MNKKVFFWVLAICSIALGLASVASATSELTYGPAKRAMQNKADGVAGKHTKIKSVFRLKRTVYSGSAQWTEVDPTGCKGCGYDPNTGEFYDTPSEESCGLSMIAKKLSSGEIRVRVENAYCL